MTGPEKQTYVAIENENFDTADHLAEFLRKHPDEFREIMDLAAEIIEAGRARERRYPRPAPQEPEQPTAQEPTKSRLLTPNQARELAKKQQQ